MFTKISKSIDLIKVPKAKNLYKPYTVIKGKSNEYKSHIYPKKHPLDLVYSDIIGPFDRGRKGGKYFIIFLDDYNKRLEVEILEVKSNIYIAYLYYTAQNEWDDIKIHRFKTNYSNKYSNY